ncbi:VOC family protein [Pseudoalteromonas sp. OOF1S-7]|uniref:VOC family protein n=1 Tax=Pseudoalteromonas sp. OOF1S-7 TaxID=2917757 RepID=UPI001EF58EA3|nr:VOC family protein [Pseudoalteromonas sp. OOF1S-7]MCG7536289.1 VOC family protein [Pseudoalteromonas sp. OOF1S-7]
MAKLIHSMVRVMDLQKSLAFYHDVLALGERRRIEFDDFSLVYLGNEEAEFELELTWNHNTGQPYELGNGYGHIAVVVDDLAPVHTKAQALGYQPKEIKSFYNGDTLVARFFFITDPDGYQIEVIERSETFK